MRNGKMDKMELEIDSFLRKAGEAWAEDSCPSSEKFLASFESALRGASANTRQAERSSFDWRRWWIPALVPAVCVVGLILVLIGRQPWAGVIAFQEGNLSVQSAGGSQGKLGDGSLVSTGTEGDALLSLDRDRIQLFLNHQTTVAVQNGSTVRLDSGEIWVQVKPESGFFGIDTPHGYVHVMGTTFGVTVTDRETRIEITSGRVVVGNEQNQTCSITPGTAATLSNESNAPVLHKTNGNSTPAWSGELLNRAMASQALAFFPSAAPDPNR
jgi:ferric-dicitrate binding protein FerR (iron transport regulator)